MPALKAAAGTRGRRGSWRRSIASESVVRTAQAGCDATSSEPLFAKVPCGGGRGFKEAVGILRQLGLGASELSCVRRCSGICTKDVGEFWVVVESTAGE